ncbi:hypothetical protein BJ944DRAFT_51694 [Cunninghamella echinulata]|nr:hypothetical protein BJ944DRAFT_51694 [Cunninghamella echinulata]
MEDWEEAPSTSGIPRNTLTLPTPIDITLTPFWTTIRQKDCLMLQKFHSAGMFKSLINTIANVFDTKQPPYRILFQREPNCTCLQIAVGETEKIIETAWLWMEQNILPEFETMTDGYSKEEWITEKIQTIVTTLDIGTDELSSDETVRNASRSFRQIFDVPSSERLVSYYSCAYNSRQGWMYISENYIGFYSFLLGVETKMLIEMKDVQDIKKEKSRRSVFSDALRIFTKDNHEYVFTTMFKRDEVYDVLVQLAGQAMLRLLKNSSGDAPGASNSNNNDNSFGPFVSSPDNHLTATNKPVSSRSTDNRILTNPLKHDLAAQKRNMDYCLHFRLPLKEQLLDALEVGYTLNNKNNGIKASFSHPTTTTTPPIRELHGRVYISETFLAYESQQRLPQPQQHQPIVWLVFPLYTIKRVERLNAGSYKSSLSITTYHNMEHIFKFHAPKPAVESFCQLLRDNLKEQTSSFKLLKPFLATCESENIFEPQQKQSDTLLVDISDPSINDEKGGLGLKFGFPGDSKLTKDRSKMKLWKQYFIGK